MSEIERKTEDGSEAEPEGLRHRRLGIAIHALVILGSGFLVLTTDDSIVRTVNILVLAVAVVSIIVLAIDPAGRRRRSQG